MKNIWRWLCCPIDIIAIIIMKTKTKKKKQIENPCMICGKDVRWGQDGCPVVDKGSEMGVLFGSWKGMRHYDCKGENEIRLGDV